MMAPAPSGPYAPAVAAGDTVFVSGQIPVDPATGAVPEGIGAQTRLAVANLLAAVRDASGGREFRIVKTTAFLADIGDLGGFNEAYAECIGRPFPARSCAAVSALPRGVLVEIEAVAVTGRLSSD
jgi:2-iminobutanoate/2-iminopropanoate deaminase